MNALDTHTEGIMGTARLPLSSRATLNPVTPLRDGGDFSPFALFSEEERKDHLRAASPTLTFEELSSILAEEWERLPEEEKTPYRDRADERRLQHETVGAAIALTQIGTPSFCPGGPTTPVPREQKARRCLDIGTPGWQSPRAPTNPVSGHDHVGSNSIADEAACRVYQAGLLGRSRSTPAGEGTPSSPFLSSSTSPPASPTTSSSTPTASSAPPAPTGRGLSPLYSSSPPVRGVGGVTRRRRGVAGRVMSSTVAAAAAAAAAASTVTPESGSVRGDRGCWPAVVRVGLEVRAAAGGATAATSKEGGSGSTQVATTSRSLGRSNKPTTTTISSSGSRKRKASSPASSSASSKRAQPSSSVEPPAVVAVAAAKAGTTVQAGVKTATASKKTRSKERARKAEYKAGREIVSKMSKKDPTRPKGPQSSYILFYAEKMVSVKAIRPDMSITDIGTAVGEAWRGLSDDKRSPYTKLAAVDRKRYEGQLRAIARKAAAAAAARCTP